MKQILITAMLLLVGAGAFGQKSPVDRIFDKYSGQEGYTTVYISSFMFNMLSSIESDDPEYEDFKKASSGIKSLRILTQESSDTKPFATELMELLPRQEYQEMMKVKDDEEEVLFLAKESGGVITEFLLIVTGGTDEVLIAITGNIDLETLSSIASGMDMPGMENLEELDDQ